MKMLSHIFFFNADSYGKKRFVQLVECNFYNVKLELLSCFYNHWLIVWKLLGKTNVIDSFCVTLSSVACSFEDLLQVNEQIKMLIVDGYLKEEIKSSSLK